MIKKLLVLLFCLFIFSLLQGQYANDWIENHNQSYYKIEITESGLYRIPYATLQNAGINVSSINPKSFQIFGRGEEQYIYVHGQQDNSFDPSDYIEFYAEYNNGWLDTALYGSIAKQPNPYYSLFNDTATYFLTWNLSINNRRVTEETDMGYINYSPSEYCFREDVYLFTDSYYYGPPYGKNIGSTDPEYMPQEGWFSERIGFPYNTSPQGITKAVTTVNNYDAGPTTEIEISVIGCSRDYAIDDTLPDHWIYFYLPDLLHTKKFTGYHLLKQKYNIQTSSLETYQSIIEVQSNTTASTSTIAKSALAYIRVKYPQTFLFDNQNAYTFYLPDDPNQAKSYLRIQDFAQNGDNCVLYDITNHKKIPLYYDNAQMVYKALVPNNGNEKKCILYNQDSVKLVNAIEPVNSYFSANGKLRDMLDLERDDAFIIITHKSLMSSVMQYNNYRNGTGHNPVVIDIDELYYQFSYGIKKHPLAIKNFMHYIANEWKTKPAYLFLVGKAYKAEMYRHDTAYYRKTLVPSFGNPASDNLFTKQIHANDIWFEPSVPTGRLAARNTQHVDLYLDKIKDYESQLPALWMKNVLHFGGGDNTGQQQAFKNILNNFKNIIQDTLYGATVKSFFKTSSAPIQIGYADSIRNLINSGVSLMTFFGHASGAGFDQDIDDPSEYDNWKKYPLLLANSCLSATLFEEVPTSSEQFVLVENKGTIGYLGNASLGIVGPLTTYSSYLYKNLTYKSYNQSIGQIIQNTIIDLSQHASELNEDVAMEMLYHGDPAVRINSFSFPDYAIDQSSISFIPAQVTTVTDSFDVYIEVKNIGMAIDTAFFIEIQRTFPDNISTQSYVKRIDAPLNTNTVKFTLPVDLLNGVGINKLRIILDYNNEIPELDDIVNNVVDYQLYIKSTDVFPVYPYQFSVIPSMQLNLKASTSDPMSPVLPYVFELDTTDLFNSPLKQTYTISQGGGVIEWPVNLPVINSSDVDSTVFYWRVSIDSAVNGNYSWRQSSFQYIKNKIGWGQAHFFQFENNEYKFVNYSRPLRQYNFVDNIVDVHAQTGVYDPEDDWTNVWYKVNGSQASLWTCLQWPNFTGMGFALFDKNNGEIIYSQNGEYNNVHCRSYPMEAFDFYTSNITWQNRVEAFLDTIPDSTYVLGYSIQNHNIENFDSTLIDAFKGIGASQIEMAENNKPYIIFGKKGWTTGMAHEELGLDVHDVIQLQDTFSVPWKNGYIISPIIGPATQWGSLHWRYKSLDTIDSDVFSVSVVGLKNTGQIDTLIYELPPVIDSMDIYNLHQRIDANTYPYIKLVAKLSDELLRTAPQIDRWQVLYEGIPETALSPNIAYSFYNDSLQEGDTILFSIATKNISDFDFPDSLLFKYWLVDRNRQVHLLDYSLKDVHPSQDIIIDSISFSSIDYIGNNTLWLEVNPIDTLTGNYHQIEQYHFNNIIQIPFNVKDDKVNPMLDVTFDGVHIMDGDIVSAKPEIRISLNDENQFLLLNDTALLKIYLKAPGESIEQRVYFNQNGQEIIHFEPASLPNNKCNIYFQPQFVENGIYELIVQARDVSYNNSGDIDYHITFEVINEASITHLINYPNPFSTSTRFVFTLTGSEIPENFRIQIYTITGKLVKEITQDELGSIHIGRNITDYTWDGTDMYGDRLANGVYLYKVIVRLKGEEIEHRNTEADSYFINNFGKMYLMR